VKLRIAIIAALGLALAFYVVFRIGTGAVLSSLATVGLGGFGIFCLYTLGLFLVLGPAWNILLSYSPRGKFWIFVRARMVRDSAAELLPFSQLGGIVFGARAAVLQGVSQSLAFASVIVDVTTEMAAQIAYIALGIAILSVRAPRSAMGTSLTAALFIGLILAVISCGVFLGLQRYGHSMLNMFSARLSRVVAAMAPISTALEEIYRSPARVGASTVLHFVGWIASAVGTWIAFHLVGADVDLESVLAIESLVCAARSAGAFIPNALGVQEAAYALLTPVFGISAEFGLAISLLKRARDIAIGVPTLVVWQIVESHRMARGAWP
jgi:glycosyltransferase 2 family protein